MWSPILVAAFAPFAGMESIRYLQSDPAFRDAVHLFFTDREYLAGLHGRILRWMALPIIVVILGMAGVVAGIIVAGITENEPAAFLAILPAAAAAWNYLAGFYLRASAGALSLDAAPVRAVGCLVVTGLSWFLFWLRMMFYIFIVAAVGGFSRYDSAADYAVSFAIISALEIFVAELRLVRARDRWFQAQGLFVRHQREILAPKIERETQ